MSTLNIPAPTISVTVDLDGTTTLSSTATLTSQEAVEVANFIITNQPGYVVPTPDEVEPNVPVPA